MPGVLLSGRDNATNEVSLLLRPGSFSTGTPCQMRAYDQRYRLQPLRVMARGAGYEIARYRVQRIADTRAA